MLNHRNLTIIFILQLLTVAAGIIFFPIPPWVFLILIAVYLAFEVYGSFNLSAQYFLDVKYKGDNSSKSVAITFDDGPIPGKTEKVLDILRANKVHAAFFCIGHRVKENPGLLKRIDEEGHVIGNHSYWHGKTFDFQTPGKISDELRQTDEVIKSTIDKTPRFFRPPYGVTNPMVSSAVKTRGYTTIGWSIRSFDTMIKDKAKLLRLVTSSVEGGSVILLHDYCDHTIEILPALLDHISKLGLKIVRVDELLNEKPYA